jgi:hypothetical protein
MNLDVQRLNGLRVRECASNLSMSIHFGRQRLLDFKCNVGNQHNGQSQFSATEGQKAFFFFWSRSIDSRKIVPCKL